MEIGWIVRLYICHFKKERYYLVYRINNNDYVLLNITGKNKKKGIDPKYQHELGKKIDLSYDSVINLNTLVLIENDLFFDLLSKVKQPEELIKLSKELFEEISKKVEICFDNESFSGNLYRVRVFPNHDKKTLMIISDISARI